MNDDASRREGFPETEALCGAANLAADFQVLESRRFSPIEALVSAARDVPDRDRLSLV